MGRVAAAPERSNGLAVPEPGQLVSVRDRQWVVSDVSRGTGAADVLASAVDGPQHLLSLVSIEEDATGEELQVIWELEPGRRVIDRTVLPTPGPDHFDPPELWGKETQSQGGGWLGSARVGLRRRAGRHIKDRAGGRVERDRPTRWRGSTSWVCSRSSRHRRPVANARFRPSESRRQGSMLPSFRRGQERCHGCRRAVKDRVVDFGRSWVPASWGGEILLRRCQVLRTVLLKGGIGGEEAVGLQPEELRPGWPDPTGRRAESALAKHPSDGRRRDVGAELQELAPDPEVAPSGVLSTEPNDQLLDRGIERRAAGPAGRTYASPP